MIFIYLNIFFVSIYIYNFDLSSGSSLLKILYFILFFLFVCIFIYKKKKDLIVKFNLSFFSLILTLIFIEVFFYLKPNLLPNSISIWLGDGEENSKLNITEILNESPFIKFKANTKIKSNGYRGGPDEFIYEWTTDKNGFKNTPEIANLEKYKILAIGDSMVEGMGVSTEDTFTTILTKKNYPTYNLGVQGYAVSQSKGAFKKFGAKLRSEIVLCLYARGNAHREIFFVDNKLKEKKTFTGGIDNQFQADQNLEIRFQGKYVLTASWLYLTFVRNNLKDFLKYGNVDFKNPIFNRYPEVRSGEKVRELRIQEMNLLIKNFKEIKKLAEINNSKFILGYIEHRDLNYYEIATGKKPHPSQFYEGDFLKKFSKENNITFIDFGVPIRNYIKNLPEDFEVSDLPYLKIDGHLNRLGNEILADTIIKYIEKH